MARRRFDSPKAVGVKGVTSESLGETRGLDPTTDPSSNSLCADLSSTDPIGKLHSIVKKIKTGRTGRRFHCRLLPLPP